MPPQFALPDRAALEVQGSDATAYGIYNYFGRGPIAAAKRRRFRKALELGGRVTATRVIDMGCADGVLLPSLSAAYEKVAAIDIEPGFVEQSRVLSETLQLENVQTICNAGRTTEEVRGDIGGGFELMYLLETLEHVGTQPDIWSSKVAFLKDCFDLLEPMGQIVISVPRMVGPVVLLKNLLQRTLRMGYDEMTWRQLLRSALLRDTDQLEPLWKGGHVGFNHDKLDRHLRQNFHVLARVDTSISVLYRIERLDPWSSIRKRPAAVIPEAVSEPVPGGA